MPLTVHRLDPRLRKGSWARLLTVWAFEVSGQPVLLIPGVLDLETCARLIQVLETWGSVETGVERTREGRREDGLDPDAKRRRDHTVEDPELLQSLTAAVGRRVMPEVRKAFAFRATRFEGFKIACYDAAAGGHFRAHRDNLSPSTAHRRFALTLNLNDGYEGGHLRFPEYGAYLYRPGAGGAVVCSGSHPHEALPVTRGRRYVLLSFLFGEIAAPTAVRWYKTGALRWRRCRCSASSFASAKARGTSRP